MDFNHKVYINESLRNGAQKQYLVQIGDVKSSHHVLNDYDTTGKKKEFLETCKRMPSVVPPATNF